MSSQPLTLLIVDDDPIFRLGLTESLNSFESIQVLGEAETPKQVISILNEQSFDIILIEPELTANSEIGWKLIQRLKQRYPRQKICLVSKTQDRNQLLMSQNQGVEGYCRKGFKIAQLVGILQQIAQGETYWEGLLASESKEITRPKRLWFTRIRQSGIEQINASINTINQYLDTEKISLIDKLFWQGRRRELLTARWLVERMIPVEVLVIQDQQKEALDDTDLDQPVSLSSSNPAIVPTMTGVLTSPFVPQQSYQETVFRNTFNQLNGNLKNNTDTCLEIDILQFDKKKGLLLVIFNQIYQLFEQLRFSEVTASHLPQNLASLLEPVWQTSSLTFLNKYSLGESAYTIDTIKMLLEQDREIIQREALDKIPFLPDLFNYLLFETPMMIQGVSYRPTSLEAIERAEQLLQNTIIQIGNAVMVFILNNLSEEEVIKDSLYQEKLLSSRKIAKFRNELSWQYRVNKYWETPKQIFESKHRVYFVEPKGIEQTDFYFPRQEELEQLQGLPRFVTIMIEIRDAIAPRLRSVTGWLGEGVVYVLTQVIGRAIGLIGRGILQGVGSTWQEARYGKNNRN